MTTGQNDRQQDWFSATILVSGAYVLSFLVTFGVLISLEERLAGSFAGFTSLMFLPHGVRVLAAWLYRWRSPFYLIPGALFGHLYLFGATFDLHLVIGWIAGLTCAPLAFTLMARLGLDLRLSRQRRTHWRELLLVGGVASVFNSLVSAWVHGNPVATMSARFVGDLTGTLVCLLVLMLAFRLVDRLRWR